MAAYDPNNIFAKILRDEFPCHKIYEDDKIIQWYYESSNTVLQTNKNQPDHTLPIIYRRKKS